LIRLNGQAKIRAFNSSRAVQINGFYRNWLVRLVNFSKLRLDTFDKFPLLSFIPNFSPGTQLKLMVSVDYDGKVIRKCNLDPIEGSFLRQRVHSNSRNTSNLQGSINQTMPILLGFMNQPSGSGSG
jgi:hypothetical protein